jgi:hypothetical protein
MRFALTSAQLALLLVAVGALANALVLAIFPPGPDASCKVHASLLGDPHDFEADLVEFSLCFPPFALVDASRWPYPYERYALQNSYHSFDLTQTPPVDVTTWSPAPATAVPTEDWQPCNPMAGPNRPDTVLSGLHVTPLMLVICSMTKRLLLAVGPRITVLLFVGLTLAALGLLCARAAPPGAPRLLAFGCLLLSAPMLQILFGGNQGALVTGVPLCGFLCLVLRQRRPLLAALLLAIACNIRPNALVLAPLLACYGTREGLRGAATFALAAAALFAAAYGTACAIYPGYSLGVFHEALDVYYRNYVLGVYGTVGNNSAFGLVKLAYLLVDQRAAPHPLLFGTAAKITSGAVLLAFAWAGRLFALGRLTAREFAFLGVATYVLATPIIALYHLLPLAAFLLVPGGRNDKPGADQLAPAILFAAALVLMPKAWFFTQRVSPEVFLNPLVLAFAAWRVLTWRAGTHPTIERRS